MKFIRLLIFVATAFSSFSAPPNFVHRTNDWATHQPVLYEMALFTEKAVIEFGCGYNSTPLLHEICKATNRILISLDDDWDWIKRFMGAYYGDGYVDDNSGWHKFYFIPGKHDQGNSVTAAHWIRFFEESAVLDSMEFDLAFVDQSPWKARLETIHRIKDKVRFVILHDCDYFAQGEHLLGSTIRKTKEKKQVAGEFDFSPTFSHFKVFFPLCPWPGASGPPTLLGSNFEEVPYIDYRKY